MFIVPIGGGGNCCIGRLNKGSGRGSKFHFVIFVGEKRTNAERGSPSYLVERDREAGA